MNFKHLLSDFGFLAEGDGTKQQEVEKDVINRLDRSVKLDEVDTVAFGLETDDGHVVKVYVKADQAEPFEKALADKLGEIDDIEEVLNELSKEFEIVEVEWPSSDDDDDSSDDADSSSDDGSEVMNSKVYNNAKEKHALAADPKTEGFNFGERATLSLYESTSSIESRFTTATQLMVYHAIIELGIPEIALARSPYRPAIIKGIKDKALDLLHNPSLRNALKVFINRAIDYDREAEKNKRDAEGEGKVNESLLTEGVVQDFWNTFIKIIKYIAPNDSASTQLLNSTQLKQIMSRSSGTLASKVSSELKLKLTALETALESAGDEAELQKAGVTESTNADEITSLLQALLTMADDSTDSSAAAAFMKSSAFNQFMSQTRSGLSGKFGGALRQKLNELMQVLPTAASSTSTTATSTTSTSSNASVSESISEWAFSVEDGTTQIKCDALSIKLDDEQTERLVKGIENHDAVVVRDTDDPAHKVTFSPRGVNVLVKKVGTSDGLMMKPKDVDELLSTVGNHKNDESDDSEMEEA